MESEEDLTGRVVAGLYRIEAKLGGGGMGVVYRAVDEVLERPVALKVVRPELVATPEFVIRFRREAKALARFKHPNSVDVYTCGEADGLLYMALEYVEGRELGKLLRETRPFPVGRAVAIALQVLSALEKAHGLGIVHRDLKPPNIMVVPEGGRDHVKILDFGIAKLKGDAHSTKAGMILGTPAYMAPEQAAAEEIDGRADLYAVGIVLHQLLAGEPPFQAGSAAMILSKQLNEPAPPVREKRPEVPAALEKVILKVLAKKPAERYQDARSFAAALEALGPIAAAPPPPPASPGSDTVAFEALEAFDPKPSPPKPIPKGRTVVQPAPARRPEAAPSAPGAPRPPFAKATSGPEPQTVSQAPTRAERPAGKPTPAPRPQRPTPVRPAKPPDTEGERPAYSEGELEAGFVSSADWGFAMRQRATSPDSFQAAPTKAYIANWGSNDVSVLALHPVSGALAPAAPVATGSRPVAIALAPSGRFAWVAHDGSDEVAVFALDPRNDVLEPSAPPVRAGSRPLALAVHPTEGFVFAAGSASNDVSAFRVRAGDGGLVPLGIPSPAGDNPRSLCVDPLGKFLLVAAYRSSAVSVFSIDRRGNLVPCGAARAGTKPRAIAVEPSGRHVYVLGSGSEDVTVLAIDADRGTLAPVGKPVPVGKNPRALVLHPSGRFAYVANTESNAISIFGIDAGTGLLDARGEPVKTPSPFALAIDPSGRFLVAASYYAKAATSFTIDAATGALARAGNPAPAGQNPYSVAIVGPAAGAQ